MSADSKSRVLPPTTRQLRFQWYRFHAPHAQYRRFIDVVAEPSPIRTRTIHQLAMIPAAIAVEFRCKLDLKAFEFNRLFSHNSDSSEENRT
jgi:hypothetical protein